MDRWIDGPMNGAADNGQRKGKGHGFGARPATDDTHSGVRKVRVFWVVAGEQQGGGCQRMLETFEA
jgi:hypothetical protein